MTADQWRPTGRREFGPALRRRGAGGCKTKQECQSSAEQYLAESVLEFHASLPRARVGQRRGKGFLRFFFGLNGPRLVHLVPSSGHLYPVSYPVVAAGCPGLVLSPHSGLKTQGREKLYPGAVKLRTT